MVNYGNSKALVAVADSHPTSIKGMSGVSSTRVRNNIAADSGNSQSLKNAWGGSGEFIEGQPLAIEYNHAAL